MALHNRYFADYPDPFGAARSSENEGELNSTVKRKAGALTRVVDIIAQDTIESASAQNRLLQLADRRQLKSIPASKYWQAPQRTGYLIS